MLYLIASLVTLAAGPLLAAAARRNRTTTLALDAFVLVVLGGVVLLHILPHALERAHPGLVALAGIAAFLLTGAAERGLHSRPDATTHRAARWLVLGLALAGLLFHAIVDGMALGGDAGDAGHDHGPGDDHGHDHGSDATAWAVAVLAHRLPFSMALWWIVAPLFGVRIALAAVGMLAVGTLAGYGLADVVLEHATAADIAVFEAVLCGTLLHVVLHADLPPAPREPRRWLRSAATFSGLAVGVAVVWLVEGSHDHGEGAGAGVAATFLRFALESAPALLLAYLAVGALQVWLPANWLGGARPRGPFAEALRGVAIGIPLPVCSCGVVPIYRQLVRQGSSAVAAMAFLIATPEIEIAAVLLTIELIGPEVAIARVATAALLAIGVALVVGRLARPAPPVPAAAAAGGCGATADGSGCGATAEDACAAADESERSAAASVPGTAPTRGGLLTALRHGFGTAVDETAAWILVGLALAALLQPHLDATALADLPSWLAVVLAAAIGMPLYVCASGSTPLAAVLIAGGLSPGAAIAFLLTGPATNVTTFGVLKAQHGGRTAVWFAVAVFVGAVLAGVATDALLPAGATAGAAVTGSPEDFGWLAWTALAILGVAIVASIVRRGVRAFLGELFGTPTFAEIQALDPAHAGHGHGHAHGHHHPHSHDHGGHHHHGPDHDHAAPQ